MSFPQTTFSHRWWKSLCTQTLLAPCRMRGSDHVRLKEISSKIIQHHNPKAKGMSAPNAQCPWTHYTASTLSQYSCSKHVCACQVVSALTKFRVRFARVGGHLLLVIDSLYSWSEVCVRVGGVKSQPFTVFWTRTTVWKTSSHLSEQRYHSDDGSGTWSESSRKDWRGKTCWPHPRQSCSEINQRPTGAITFSAFLGLATVWSHKNYQSLLKTVPWGISRPPGVAAPLPSPEEKRVRK